MKFVPSDQLKSGMRLAKPIYNKNGVMLYERDSKLTPQGINSIINFGLIGIYILEPAEPLPPMSEEDREFERFQTVSVFKLKEMMDDIQAGNQPRNLNIFVNEIIKNYGTKKEKVNFTQNLRSNEDNVYKHSLNVAILCAAITSKMTVSFEEQKNIIIAALFHDIGSLDIPPQVASVSVDMLSEQDKNVINKCREDGYRTLRESCDFESDVMKNISFLLRDLKEFDNEVRDVDKRPRDMAVEILKVAYMYDVKTAMKYGEEPYSDIAAYKYLIDPATRLPRQVVSALTYAINIVPAGCSVQFENGTKGIVLTENADDILRPFILSYKDNKIYNLADSSVYKEFKIKDVLKTLDNRYIMTDKYQEYMDKLAGGEEKVIKVGKKND